MSYLVETKSVECFVNTGHVVHSAKETKQVYDTTGVRCVVYHTVTYRFVECISVLCVP